MYLCVEDIKYVSVMFWTVIFMGSWICNNKDIYVAVVTYNATLILINTIL